MDRRRCATLKNAALSRGDKRGMVRVLRQHCCRDLADAIARAGHGRGQRETSRKPRAKPATDLVAGLAGRAASMARHDAPAGCRRRGVIVLGEALAEARRRQPRSTAWISTASGGRVSSYGNALTARWASWRSRLQALIAAAAGDAVLCPDRGRGSVMVRSHATMRWRRSVAACPPQTTCCASGAVVIASAASRLRHWRWSRSRWRRAPLVAQHTAPSARSEERTRRSASSPAEAGRILQLIVSEGSCSTGGLLGGAASASPATAR